MLHPIMTMRSYLQLFLVEVKHQLRLWVCRAIEVFAAIELDGFCGQSQLLDDLSCSLFHSVRIVIPDVQ